MSTKFGLDHEPNICGETIKYTNIKSSWTCG